MSKQKKTDVFIQMMKGDYYGFFNLFNGWLPRQADFIYAFPNLILWIWAVQSQLNFLNHFSNL